MGIPDRAAALELWRRYNNDDWLYKHALAVEAVMRHFAQEMGEDAEYWGIVGLLHDIDYGQFPEEHLAHARAILEQGGFPDGFIRSVESHGFGICTDVKPEHPMEKVLFAIDELTGFITAVAIMRPSKSLFDLEARSVLKKWKTAAFAAKIRRDIIEEGAAMTGIELSILIDKTIAGMKKIADALDLRGSISQAT